MSGPPQSEPTPAAASSPRARGAMDAGGRGAVLVAAGILLSRVLGLVRERVFAHYFGSSAAAAAFKAAQRIPNFLQNLFGEGVLSASFFPVYARLRAAEEDEEADRVAGAVFGILALVTGVLVAAGMALTPWFLDLVAPGFEGESRALAISLVRIVFPGTGMLVMSAWCLGILNSHRRFFLPYAAPALWNLVQIGTLWAVGRGAAQDRLAQWLAWATVGGSALQFLVQLPEVVRLLGRFRPSLDLARKNVRQVLRSFGPVVGGRGVVQISAYVDTAFASLITERALAVLAYAQALYLIPVSLFGMAVSAAELPEMARATGTPEEVARKVRERIELASRRIAFFVVPSAAALLALGDVVGAAVLQTGRFGPRDARYLWYVLIGSTVGLLASTLGRLFASAFYALRDTRTPLYFAALRVALGASAAYWVALRVPGLLGLPRELGAAGITVTSGLTAWLEYLLLRWRLGQRIGRAGIGMWELARLWLAAGIAAAAGIGVKVTLVRWRGPAPGGELEWYGSVLPAPAMHPVLAGALVLSAFGVLYLALTALMGNEQARAAIGRVWRRRPASQRTD